MVRIDNDAEIIDQFSKQASHKSTQSLIDMAGIHHCFTVLNSAYGFRFVGSAAAKVVAHHAWVLGTFAVLLFSVNRAIAALDTSIPAHLEFNRDVRPILSDNCFHCHGPDKNARQAELRLDIREEAVKTAGSGATPIAPSKPDQSEVVRRIYSNNPDEIMPPPDSHKTLSEGQKEILKNWIVGGAIYQKHWSFEPPIKPNVAAGSNAIDVLVRKRLSDIGLTASPAADKRTLIRRLYFDLLGLPPSPQDVVNFEGDRSADAYVRLADRLLQNPHYGERMALGWLDIVRFADTIGYHSDNVMNVWPYRDWVIRSFNDNKRFDQFTCEQLAGDLLPDASQETRVGSAFNRLLLTTEEGGAQPKDYEARMLTDRVRAIGAVWLGLTTGCAQCHDHKFDPFTARDFYSLGAFFADIDEPIIGRREEGMPVKTPDDEKQLANLDSQLANAKSKMEAAQMQWEENIAAGEALLPELRANAKAGEAEKIQAHRVADILNKKTEKRTPDESKLVTEYFQTRLKSTAAAERAAVVKAEAERKKFYDALPKVLVSKTMANKRTVRILPRGNWMDESGEVVHPAVPHFLTQTKTASRELTRLDLAEWVISKQNPLTARTVMNRLWQQFFGVGLSRVLDDLGAQGEPPVNPPLLDWLACEFMDSGWDMKHMVRLIVTSDTYKQVSTANHELLIRDPANRELARQSGVRLDAELVRDNALAIAGLLSTKIGGPSIMPYQPAGYWDNINYPPRPYLADEGSKQYGRGLYIWRQRSFPHPSLLAFDATSREACTAERTRSNIPQQALVLLNDPTYVEAARTFAARILKECSGSQKDRIRWAWQEALQRDPSEDEIQTMKNLLAARLADYRGDASSSDALLKIGFAALPKGIDKTELAAWTHVARVLLNLHETITRS